MKSKFLVMLLAILALVMLPSCEKPGSGNTSAKIKTVSATEVSAFSALLTGEVGVEVADYKSVDFGMLISKEKSDLQSYKGQIISGSKLIGQSFSVEAKGLSAETKYYYRAYLVLNDIQEEYGEVKSFTTEKKGKMTIEMVDLGLTVKWANMNIGATAPEEYGDYFAWGETEPKTNYLWSTYKYYNDSSSTMTKYCTDSSYGTVDNKTTLDPEDDAAHVNWGGNWRMPTRMEQDELHNKCTWTWTSLNGVSGYRVTGTNGNSIFLPAAGYRNDTDLLDAGSLGYYWSSSLGEYNYAFSLRFNSLYCDWGYGNRYDGQSVRAVCQ